MSSLKTLASQTAVYGLSSIVGRLLNYLLVPLYTRVFVPAEYGVVTELYAYTAFFAILFTYGFETAYFRFSEKEKNNPSVFSTAFLSVGFTSVVLALMVVLFSGQLSDLVNDEGRTYEVLPQYISWFAWILAFDAVSAIPFAKLRQENKAWRFALLKLIGIAINIGLNLFFLVLCPVLANDSHSWIHSIYDPAIGIGYVFISNLVSAAITLALLLPDMTRGLRAFDSLLWKRMMLYSLPLVVAGFSGMINETLDRILIPQLVADKNIAMEQLGIYGACYKISVIMTLFIQTFRYAAEPFFFAQASTDHGRENYSRVMHYFILCGTLIFLTVALYLDIFKYFVGPEYRSGLAVVPILLLANLFLGVYFNLSIWYKLTGQTQWGAWIAILGAAITIGLNIWLIPVIGYLGAAWATLVCYASMMVISYLLGQKYYPVSYPLGTFFKFTALAVLLVAASRWIEEAGLNAGVFFAVNSVLLFIFIAVAAYSERSKIAYLRKPFRKTKPGENK